MFRNCWHTYSSWRNMCRSNRPRSFFFAFPNIFTTPYQHVCPHTDTPRADPFLLQVASPHHLLSSMKWWLISFKQNGNQGKIIHCSYGDSVGYFIITPFLTDHNKSKFKKRDKNVIVFFLWSLQLRVSHSNSYSCILMQESYQLGLLTDIVLCALSAKYAWGLFTHLTRNKSKNNDNQLQICNITVELSDKIIEFYIK